MPKREFYYSADKVQHGCCYTHAICYKQDGEEFILCETYNLEEAIFICAALNAFEPLHIEW